MSVDTKRMREMADEMISCTRIQLKRTKGWRMPPNTVKVDRSTKWGNPWKGGGTICGGRRLSAKDAVGLFRESAIAGELFDADELTELRGKNLACWCKPGAPCHADVLLEIANACITDPLPRLQCEEGQE